jgi:hypothetical protein
VNRKLILLFIVGPAAWMLTACGSRPSESGSATQPPTSTLFKFTSSATSIYTTEVNREKQKWLSHKIASYRIVIKFYENFLNQLKSQREVIVRRGKVISSSCVNDVCPAIVLANVFTIDDLFGVTQGSSVESLVQTGSAAFDSCVKSMIFDDTYGFPKFLAFECRGSYDMDHSVEVIYFEVLKEESTPN